MAKALTESQKDTLRYIKGYIIDVGYSPSIRDIAQSAGVSSKAIHDRLIALEKKGYISRAERVPRSIRILKEFE